MRKKFLKEVKPLPEDITKFESGIDVDSASDSMAKKPDTEFLRKFFGRVETANFLVPYGETVTTIPLLDIKEKGKISKTRKAKRRTSKANSARREKT